MPSSPDLSSSELEAKTEGQVEVKALDDGCTKTTIENDDVFTSDESDENSVSVATTKTMKNSASLITGNGSLQNAKQALQVSQGRPNFVWPLSRP